VLIVIFLKSHIHVCNKYVISK